MNNDLHRPFDLAKLDFEKIRLRRRKRLLLFTSPLIIIACVVGIKWVSLSLFTTLSNDASKRGDYDSAISWLQPLTLANFIKPYIVYYNIGTAEFQKSDYDSAEKSFRRSLELRPGNDECSVRLNLSLTLEKQADLLVEADDIDNAIVKYDETKAVVLDSQTPCEVDVTTGLATMGATGDTEKSTDEQRQLLYEIYKRITEKSDQQKKQRNGDGDEDNNNDDGSNEQEDENMPSDEQLEELEEQNKDQRQEESERSRQGGGSQSQGDSGGQNNEQTEFW